ncbi:hypothetical protein [Microbacterium excoecariae]|nr:hypothetical protein [Microbacterium excoecariae]
MIGKPRYSSTFMFEVDEYRVVIAEIQFVYGHATLGLAHRPGQETA